MTELVHPADRYQDIDLAPEVQEHLAHLRSISGFVREVAEENRAALEETAEQRGLRWGRAW